MESYSQCGQDLFVYTLLGSDKTYLDLGCYLPKKINNTYLLEQNGWSGVSIDIIDYGSEWSVRSNPFICQDCFTIDYKVLLPQHYNTTTIDYLSLDMEKVGERYKLLETMLTTGYDYRVVTIEHDSYLGEDYVHNEKIPQRNLLTKHGYVLLCADVSQEAYPELYYEDWWINPKYFNLDTLKTWQANRTSCDQIFHKNNIKYTINDESKKW
jgi:hypothetical protein